MGITQNRRTIAIDTPLGTDVLLLQRFRGSETMSQGFRFDLDLLSENRAIDFDAIVGRPVTVTVRTTIDHAERHFHGIISRFVQGGLDGTLTSYRAEMVPWTWWLTRASDCRVYNEGKAIPEIIRQVFERHHLTDFEIRVQSSPRGRENYCVQYRETDFNFVSRLLEQYGLFYYFKHERGRHTLVVADGADAPVCPNQRSLRCHDTLGGVNLSEHIVSSWHWEQEVRSAKFALSDYNFRTPKLALGVAVATQGKVPPGPTLEIFDYPGEYEALGIGKDLATIRLQEEEALRLTATGASSSPFLTVGHQFKLTQHYSKKMNIAWLLTSVVHDASEPSYTRDDDVGGEYANTFVCQPASVPFRPPRVTPRPIIQGPQTATVVGKAGEEIWVDKFGRVTVQFHWDRHGNRDEKSSCPVRVAQGVAGRGWGSFFLPRIGQEVVVEFLEGDPDQPIITGSVYNGEQTTPYTLPAEQTKSTIKTNSSKGGGGFNEVRLEDKKGSEQIYVHGEKDLDIVIKNERRESIGASRHLTVGGDRLENVTGAQHLKVGAERSEEIGADQSLKVTGNRNEDIGQKHSLKVGSDLVIDAGTNVSGKAGQQIYLKGGMTVVIEAGMQITIKGAGGFISIDPSGVTIQGTLVKINSGGSAGSGSAKSVTAPKAPKAPKKAAG